MTDEQEAASELITQRLLLHTDYTHLLPWLRSLKPDGQ